MLPSIARNEEGALIQSRSSPYNRTAAEDERLFLTYKDDIEDETKLHNIKVSISHLINDIRSLEERVGSRESELTKQKSAVASLELHHVTTLSDIRSRVARSDAAISSLSGEVREKEAKLRHLQNDDISRWRQLEIRMQKIDDYVNVLSAKVDTSDIIHQSKLSNLAGDTGQQIKSADASVNSNIDRIRFSIESQKRDYKDDLQKLETKILQSIDNKFNEVDKRMARLDALLQNSSSYHKECLKSLEIIISEHKQENCDARKAIHNTLTMSIADALRERDYAYDGLKKEMRKGLLSVGDSIGELQQVDEAKRKLLKEQLKKEINDVQKMFFLV